MDQAELDVALEELELRLERLRALYEQYFLGLEKIEPAVARKDVDRRIYLLRREKIRNTAKRFKLQTIIQRYNTFQQYWQRICREIENGTYKRHLLRAQKNNGELLTIAARRRLGRQARLGEPAEADSGGEEAAPEPQVAPAPEPQVVPPPEARVAPPPAAAAAPPTRPPGSPSLPPRLIPAAAIAALAPSSAPAPKPTSSLAPKPAAAASLPNKPAASLAPRPTAKLESLDLDMDFMGDWDPSAARAPAKPASPPAKPLGATRVAPAAQPAAPKPAAPAPPAPPPAPAAARPGSIPPRPVSLPPRPAASIPPRPAAARVAPPPKPAPLAKPAAPAAALAPSKLGAAPLQRPAATQSLKPAAPAASSSNVDDQRMRDLHSRLQQAKQQTKEANVSYEGLARSIRAAEAKLREQHENRRIDFDVVIKDGKAVVKPIVR